MNTTALSALSPEEVSALRHDLRTPINHIMGYCELLLEDASGPGQELRQAALDAALATAREVLAMVESSLPASGERVSQVDLDALYVRLREPHGRIMAAMATLEQPGEQAANAEFLADVSRIRHATDQLVTPVRPSPGGMTAPMAVQGPGNAPQPGATEPAPSATGRGRILVVDDMEDNRLVLARHLMRHGYEVETAVNGPEALAMVAHTSYDLVLLDMRMPGMDGYQVLGQIKQDPRTRDVPVVMISATDELATIAACIEAGAEDYLPKPFDPVVLRARTSASVEKKRLRNLEVDYLHQVDRVVQAATEVENGSYVAGSLAEVGRRDDAIGRLARVFDAMAAGIRAREERLRAQVGNLRREIDEATRSASGPSMAELDAGMLIPGESFAERYQITRIVGRGGMGTVYKALDRELGEDIAIKLLRADVLSSDPTMADRFRSEIRLARRISHRNVVRTHDFGEWNGTSYVTMEYVEGITLRELIDTRRKLSPSSALGIARQLAAALAVAHEQGVIHRDIKPQNLALDASGVLKVMDFGIARLAGAVSSLTQTGMVVGTPAYMAPEQLLDEQVDGRSDLYAVGVVLYECLTGALPYSATSPITLIAKVLSGAPPAPVERNPDVPLALSSLIMRLMAKAPGDRPRSADELGELLAQIE